MFVVIELLKTENSSFRKKKTILLFCFVLFMINERLVKFNEFSENPDEVLFFFEEAWNKIEM